MFRSDDCGAIMISFRPITSRVAWRLFGGSLDRVAEETVVLAGSSSWPVDPPIMLPDEPERILAHHSDSVPALNMERLTRRVMEQAPTRMHLLRNAFIADGAVMTAGFFHRLTPGKRHFLSHGHPEQIEEAALCSTYLTEKYFGHWLREGVSLEQLAADEGLLPLVLARRAWVHEPSYRDMLSLHPRRTGLAWCDRLWVFDHFQFNGAFVETYSRLRERLRAQLSAPATAGLRVFLARGDTGHGRRMANREHVKEALAARGFAIVQPELLEAREIATILAGARLVVSPEGSALAHAAIAMPRGAGLLTIIGAQHFNVLYKTISDALGFRFGLTIADVVDKDQFSQPIGRLLRTIDLVEEAIERGPSDYAQTRVH